MSFRIYQIYWFIKNICGAADIKLLKKIIKKTPHDESSERVNMQVKTYFDTWDEKISYIYSYFIQNLEKICYVILYIK